jgi:hypothetical protein
MWLKDEWRHVMDVRRACQCIITLSLIGIGVPTQPAAATFGSETQPSASGKHEPRKPSAPEPANRAGKPKDAPTPPSPAQQVEERVRSGQMEQPTAQGAISERLNQLESGSNSLSGQTAAGHSTR